MLTIERLEIADDDSGTDTTVRHMLRLIRQGAHSPDVIATAAAICDRAPAASPYHQIAALRAWCKERWCFLDDPDAIELLYGADTQLSMIDRHGCMPADCDDAAILFGALGAARGFDVRVICVAFLTPAAPYAHTWAELRPPTEKAPWIEGDVTRDMQEIPLRQISRVGIWDYDGFLSGALMATRERCDRSSVPTDVGMFVSPVAEARGSGLGFTIPIIGIDTNDITDIAKFASSFSGGGGVSTNDRAEAIWRNIKPSDTLTLDTLQIHVKDGKWYDAGNDTLLSQGDSDFRASGLMAELIGAHIGGPNDRYYYDDLDLHKLTPEESLQRWAATFGASATIESALRSLQSAQRGTGSAPAPTNTAIGTASGTPGVTYTRPATPATSYRPGTRPPGTAVQSAAPAPFNWKPIAIGAASAVGLAVALKALSSGRE